MYSGGRWPGVWLHNDDRCWTSQEARTRKIVVVVPTASLHTIELVAEEVEMIVCPNIRTGNYFAVAEAYRNWYDLSREEVVGMLRTHRLLSGKVE